VDEEEAEDCCRNSAAGPVTTARDEAFDYNNQKAYFQWHVGCNH